MKYWIKERDNPQLGIYFIACGQLSKAAAKRRECALYGENIMRSFDTEEAYNEELAMLRARNERVQ